MVNLDDMDKLIDKNIFGEEDLISKESIIEQEARFKDVTMPARRKDFREITVYKEGEIKTIIGLDFGIAEENPQGKIYGIFIRQGLTVKDKSDPYEPTNTADFGSMTNPGFYAITERKLTLKDTQDTDLIGKTYLDYSTLSELLKSYELFRSFYEIIENMITAAEKNLRKRVLKRSELAKPLTREEDDNTIPANSNSNY